MNKLVPFTLSFLFIISGCREKPSKRPNIVFIMSDDHASKAISAYGGGLINTPHLDKMAEQGLLFENSFVTNSICAPSRAVILTGKYSHLNGVRDNNTSFDGSQFTFPKLLQAKGYETAMIGKWHLKSQPTGFDFWNILPGQGDYYNPRFIINGKDISYIGYVTDIITRQSINWLANRDQSKPFLLMMHHKAPHRNWMPSLKYLDEFEDTEWPEPESFFDNYEGREHLRHQQLSISDHISWSYDLKIPCDTCTEAKINQWTQGTYELKMKQLNDDQREAWQNGYQEEIESFHSLNHGNKKEVTRWKLNRYLQDYLRCIRSIDESVGTLNSFLEKNGLAEHTLVIYTSDQGFFLGEHGLFDKRYMYEESFRTPLIMKYPHGMIQGERVEQLVMNLDIAPTIISVAGIQIPGEIQGSPLTPFFKHKKNENWRDAVYYHYYEDNFGVPPHYGIRTKEYKLIHFETEPVSRELYNLKNDPLELHNIYSKETSVSVVKELKAKMNQLRTQYSIN